VALALATGGIIWQLGRGHTPTVLSAATGFVPPLGLADSPPPSTDQLQNADKAIVYDLDQKKILFQQNAFAPHPLASITKLMTAMVALDHGIPWKKQATINLDEYGVGGNLMLFNGETVTMRDLFIASLLGSANNATKAYVRELGIPTDEFVQEMNRKAVEIGLEQTQFYDVTGLNTHNTSTAYDIALMAGYAFSHYPDIATVTSLPEYSFLVGGSGREHTLHSTNKLISEHVEPLTGSKTGYLDESKYCLVVRGGGTDKNKIVVALGSPSQEANEAVVKYLLHLPVAD